MNESLNSLRLSVDELATEVHALRAEHRRNTSLLWATLLAGALILLIVAAFAFGVALDNRRAIEANNRRWCPMVGVLLPKPGEPKPDTERGRIVVDSARQLYEDFGCV